MQLWRLREPWAESVRDQIQNWNHQLWRMDINTNIRISALTRRRRTSTTRRRRKAASTWAAAHRQNHFTLLLIFLLTISILLHLQTFLSQIHQHPPQMCILRPHILLHLFPVRCKGQVHFITNGHPLSPMAILHGHIGLTSRILLTLVIILIRTLTLVIRQFTITNLIMVPIPTLNFQLEIVMVCKILLHLGVSKWVRMGWMGRMVWTEWILVHLLLSVWRRLVTLMSYTRRCRLFHTFLLEFREEKQGWKHLWG